MHLGQSWWQNVQIVHIPLSYDSIDSPLILNKKLDSPNSYSCFTFQIDEFEQTGISSNQDSTQLVSYTIQ